LKGHKGSSPEREEDAWPLETKGARAVSRQASEAVGAKKEGEAGEARVPKARPGEESLARYKKGCGKELLGRSEAEKDALFRSQREPEAGRRNLLKRKGVRKVRGRAESGGMGSNL